MPTNPLILIIAAEVAIALLLLMGFLLLHIRGLRRIINALESKVLALRDTLKGARRDHKAVQRQLEQQKQSATDYGDTLDTLIAATRNHHLLLAPDRDIVLDIASDAPPERQAAALRHAFLIAEKEAWMAAEGKEVDWTVLQSKLSQIIQFYAQPIPGASDGNAPEDAASKTAGNIEVLHETIENQKRHIDNLEKFKKLFFDTDEKWRLASEQAAEYHRELMEKGRVLGAGNEFDTLLEKYNQVYADYGATLIQHIQSDHEGTIERGGEQPSVGRIVIANQEEIQRLRNMAVDQHKMIVRLRDELSAANSAEEKERVIAELHKQLERHERFIKESELCTRQLEEELERVIDDNQSLKLKLLQVKQEATPEAMADVEQMAKIIEDFTVQSSEMLSAIEALESECRDLRAKVAVGGADESEVGVLKAQLERSQQELATLKGEHIQLEERYLELKVQSL